MVDIKHLAVTIDTVVGAHARMKNPLGTTFDLAEVVVLPFDEKLASSPFLYVWSKATEEMFAGVHGIWLVSTEAAIEIYVGLGTRVFVNNAFGHLNKEALDMSLFFEVPAGLLAGSN